MGRMPKRFLRVTRSLENLSSGEKRAGCADLVGLPSSSSFCMNHSILGEPAGTPRCARFKLLGYSLCLNSLLTSHNVIATQLNRLTCKNEPHGASEPELYEKGWQRGGVPSTCSSIGVPSSCSIASPHHPGST